MYIFFIFLGGQMLKHHQKSTQINRWIYSELFTDVHGGREKLLPDQRIPRVQLFTTLFWSRWMVIPVK